MVLSVISIAVLIGVIATRLRSEEARLTDYLETAREVTSIYEGLAADIENLVDSFEDVERPAVIERLDEATRAADEADTRLATADPPSSAAVANGYAVAASSSWRDGLRGLNGALLILIDEPQSPEGLVLLERALLDLEVGDRAYGRFVTAVATIEANQDVAPRITADIRFVAEGADQVYDAALMAERIKAIRDLSARHDMAVSAVRFDPEEAGDRDGVPVVPFSPTFGVQVTVTNRGNEPEEQVLVNLLLIQSDGTLPPFADSRTVGLLEPGEATTLTFSRLPVVAGQFHEIVVRAELDGDADPDSNEYRQVFFRNDST